MSDQLKLQDKKEYETPEVIHRQVLEAVAGACDPNDPNDPGKGELDATCSTISS